MPIIIQEVMNSGVGLKPIIPMKERNLTSQEFLRFLRSQSKKGIYNI